jgi:hypothetical protein
MNNRMLRLFLIGAVSNLLFVSWCSAVSFYVRKGANGANNGADWTNAWSEMNSVKYSLISPGDTIYIAAGTYGSLNIIKSGTPGQPIIVKRATNAEHGPATGWISSYDGRVIIDGGGSLAAIGIGEGGSFTGQSHITIDGVTKYGMWLRNAMYGVRADRGSSDNITLHYLEMGDAGPYKMGEDGIQGRGDNLLVEYCYIHDNDNISTHGDGVQWFAGNNLTFRYNIFKNNGQMFMLSETAFGSNDYVNNLNIYYNVFYNRGGGHYNGISKKLCPQAGFYWRVYNNTFDLDAPTAASSWQDEIFSGAGSCTQMEFINNAVINSRAYSLNSVTHRFNGYDNSGQYAVINVPTETSKVVAADLGFVNINAADYHLTPSSPLIGKGTNVNLTQDFDGNPVPATPSMGAFESGALFAPTNLRVIP